MWHGTWGWEGHVDARRRLRRRTTFNGSMIRFGLVVSVLGDLIVFACLFFPFVCFDHSCLDIRLYVFAALPASCVLRGYNCVSFVFVLFVTFDSIRHMANGSALLCLEGICLVSLSLCRVMFVCLVL